MVALQTTPETKRLRQIMRHIEDVREDCEVLAANLIDRGEFAVGKSLIQHGLVHDASKLDGIEWEHLGVAGDPLHELAWRHHVENNAHHPEFWGSDGVHAMERVYVSELVCDWHARSSEMGTDLREWIKREAMPRFHFSTADQVGRDIEDLVELLLEHWN